MYTCTLVYNYTFHDLRISTTKSIHIRCDLHSYNVRIFRSQNVILNIEKINLLECLVYLKSLQRSRF